jgi:hypothetical protein
LFILALAVSGCVRRETLAIVPATMAAAPSPLNHPESTAYVLVENATLSARVKFRSVHRWKLGIVARGQPAADGTWPQLRVEITGTFPKTVVVDHGDSVPYWLPFVTEPGFVDLKLSLLNGRASGGPGVVIERVEIVPL